jgi:hypothetical protein
MNLNINKISNEEDGFLITYHTDNGAKIIIVNGKNIVEELNKGFEDLKKIADDRKAKNEAREKAYAEQCGKYPLAAAGQLNSSNSLNYSEDITRAA